MKRHKCRGPRVLLGGSSTRKDGQTSAMLETMNKRPAVHSIERTLELDFVRATENAALNVFKWIGKGQKNEADAAACDAIEGMFDLIDARVTVSISEGAKDEAPHFDVGKRLGRSEEHTSELQSLRHLV